MLFDFPVSISGWIQKARLTQIKVQGKRKGETILYDTEADSTRRTPDLAKPHYPKSAVTFAHNILSLL